MSLTLEQLNAAAAPQATQLLDGVYGHSPWIVETTLAFARSLIGAKQLAKDLGEQPLTPDVVKFSPDNCSDSDYVSAAMIGRNRKVID